MYDVIIIGSGPAGYTAGIYAIRSGLSVLILEGERWGGQLITTTIIENYPGYLNIDGYDLMNNMRNQCISQGCITVKEFAISVIPEYKNHIVKTNTNKYNGKAIIIATGANAKKLNVIGSDVFWNKGISACAVCDGALPIFRNKPLAVIGGGDTACEESLFLSKFGSIVYMIIRSSKMRASQTMQKRVLSNPKIKIIYNADVTEAKGDDMLKEILLKSDEYTKLDVFGLFYAIGHTPNTDIFNFLDKYDDGYLITSNTKTNVSGIFACGDVQDKMYRQAITAAGSGCMAAMEVYKYLQDN